MLYLQLVEVGLVRLAAQVVLEVPGGVEGGHVADDATREPDGG